MDHDKFNIAVVSGKLGGVDGVSLEVNKWIEILQKMGHNIYTIAGTYVQHLSNVPAENQLEIPDIRFTSEFQHQVELQVFPHMWKHPPHPAHEEIDRLCGRIETAGRELASLIHEYVKSNNIDVVIAQNTNAMPMTLLGGMAMFYLSTKYRVATIFHHHDFWWERSRFSNSRIEKLLNRIMPPVDLGLEHVVISSYAAHILSSLKRVQPHIIPNCEDFDTPPVGDDYNSHFRSDLGFRPDDILVVQPTRIVARKRIEDSLLFLGHLAGRYSDLRPRLHYIISLYQGDEPDQDYIDLIRNRADESGIPLHFISDRVASLRGTTAKGERLYSNRDVLVNADLVTYLPIWEGFGNALLEAVAARVPVVATTYLVYKTDIMTSGIRTIEIRDRYDENGNLVIDNFVLDEVHRILTHPEQRERLVEHNFEMAKREYGLDTLYRRLEHVLNEYGDEIRASRKRLRKTKARYSV